LSTALRVIGHFAQLSAHRNMCSLLLMFAVAGAPLARMLRVAEVDSGTGSQQRTEAARGTLPQYSYQVLFGNQLTDLPAKDTKGTQQKAPRILKPVADHWDKATRIHVGSAEVAAAIPLVEISRPACPVATSIAEFHPLFFLPQPPGCGPPA
jgi:hypothetical protein